MQHYELAYIVPIKYLDDELQKVNETVASMLKSFGGEITATEDMGKRRLAYPIEQVFQGSYFAIEFNMDSVEIPQFEAKLKLQKEVLRHMIVTKRIKSSEEVERENKIREGLKTAKQEELNKIEEEEKSSIKKEEEVIVEEKKEKNKAKLEDLDKKLDEILKDDII